MPCPDTRAQAAVPRPYSRTRYEVTDTLGFFSSKRRPTYVGIGGVIINDIIKMIMLHGVFSSGGKEMISYEESNFIRRKKRGTQENAQTLQELPLG